MFIDFSQDNLQTPQPWLQSSHSLTWESVCTQIELYARLLCNRFEIFFWKQLRLTFILNKVDNTLSWFKCVLMLSVKKYTVYLILAKRVYSVYKILWELMSNSWMKTIIMYYRNTNLHKLKSLCLRFQHSLWILGIHENKLLSRSFSRVFHNSNGSSCL